MQADPAAEFVGYSEIDKFAISVYEGHFPGVHNYGDITQIDETKLPDFDCLVGGFPCQAFSGAGKRRGFADTRGTLFFDLARIAKEKRPRLCVFENVKGLLSHDGGRTFTTIVATLDELGYDCQWQVLNSKDFGVPQNRERVIIVGHLRGTPRPEVFPITSDGGKDSESLEQAEIVGTIDTGIAKNHRQSGATYIKQLKNARHDHERIYGVDGISPTLNTGQRGNAQPKIVAQRGRYNGDGTTSQRIEERPDNVSNTLTAVQKDNMLLDGYGLRRLTPVECERLQGFPDDWTRYGLLVGGTDPELDSYEVSQTQRYKMCGNAVTTNVIATVFEQIMGAA